MKISLLKCAILLLTLTYLQVKTAEQKKLYSAKEYTRELFIWHQVFCTLKKDCTLQEACSVILKYEDVIHAQSTSSEPLSSTSNANDRFSKRLDSYMRELNDEYSKKKEVFLTCTIMDACALMLKRNERAHADRAHEIFLHSKASKSCLWPSIRNLELGKKALDDWHQICQEVLPGCTLLQASMVIVMHQIIILQHGRFYPDLPARCRAGLRKQHKLLKKIYKNCTECEAYAFCMKYPVKILSDCEHQMLKKYRPYEDEYQLYLKKELERTQDVPEYVE